MTSITKRLNLLRTSWICNIKKKTITLTHIYIYIMYILCIYIYIMYIYILCIYIYVNLRGPRQHVRSGFPVPERLPQHAAAV